MTLKLKPKFTPELLISAPRPSSAVPNDDGSLAFFTVSTYDLDTHVETKEVKILDIETGKTWLFTDDNKNKSFSWLTGNLLLWQKTAEGGKTELWIGDAAKENRPYYAGSITADLNNLHTKKLSDGSIAFVFTASADQDQNLINPSTAEKPKTTAREWDTSRPRIWDTHVDQYRAVIWYSTLQKNGDKYKLSETGPINALRDTGLSVPFYSDPLDSVDVDVSGAGIIFATMEPTDGNEFDNGLHTSLYYLPLETYQETDVPPLRKITMPGYLNYSSPTFAPQGRCAAFIAAGEEWYDYGKIFLMSLDTFKPVLEIRAFADSKHQVDWDIAPQSLQWSNDCSSLYVTANDHAYTKVFKMSIPSSLPKSGVQNVVPTALSVSGSVSSVHTLGKSPNESRLLVNSTSFTDPATSSIVSPAASKDSTSSTTKVLLSASQFGSLYGISPSQVSSIHVPNGGADGKTPVQFWLLKPSSYNRHTPHKYPLFLYMHGGPSVAVTDAWSTRWNALFFAEQGYIVAIPNFTGSDSFGVEFLKGNKQQWGGAPYKDLELCFEWIEKNEPKCDTTRSVAAGGSYGGYLANWIAGQPLGAKMKAIVSHDGIFDFFSSMLGDDAASGKDVEVAIGPKFWSLGGSDISAAKDIWRKYNPVEYISNWSTPMLFIHSDRDFRCQITDAWAGYNICRMKGIETRMLNYPDENHWVLGRENSLKWMKTVMGWCNKYAGIEGEGAVGLPEAVNEAKWVGARKEGRILEV